MKKRQRNKNHWSAHQRPGSGPIPCYNATLSAYGSTVTDEAHLRDLFLVMRAIDLAPATTYILFCKKRGCYGKGLVSRSKPDRMIRGNKAIRVATAENPFHGQVSELIIVVFLASF
jgi:hypothetical protein